jgi:hypothetical protein
MSDETLERAEKILLDLLSNTDAITPTDLLVRAAEKRQAGLTAETLRIALWGLLSSGAVIQTPDHSLLRTEHDAWQGTAQNAAFA